MTGLKSGSGDDLWGDEEGDSDDEERLDEPAESSTGERNDDSQRDDDDRRDSGSDDVTADADEGRGRARGIDPDQPNVTRTEDRSEETRPYVVRRAIQDKPVQFEREERLTFFVHDDVAEGERELVTDVESTLGRDVPKFDVREAVYRAALRNPEDVLEELLEMGYTLDE